MATILRIFRYDTVLSVASLLMLLSLFFVPPSAEYWGYINWEVLAVLFSFMGVVEGLMLCGLFSRVSTLIVDRCNNMRTLAAVLVGLCFFVSMLVTNNVVLLALVPLALIVLKGVSQRNIIYIVVLMTVSANLGSMLTPMGTPRNIFLYTTYAMEMGEFIRILAPTCAFSLVLLLMLLTWVPNKNLPVDQKIEHRGPIDHKRMLMHLGLLALCIVCIFHEAHFGICLAICLFALALFDRGALRRVDYTLLATFVVIFILVGNIARFPIVAHLVEELITGREFWASVILCQGISNMPTAMLISSFTPKADAPALILGANIGGIGTIVASLGSLITYRFYASRRKANRSLYFTTFALINAFILISLLLFVFFAQRQYR